MFSIFAQFDVKYYLNNLFYSVFNLSVVLAEDGKVRLLLTSLVVRVANFSVFIFIEEWLLIDIKK